MLQVIDFINGIIWGPITLVLVFGTGIYLTLGLRGITLTHIPYGFRELFKNRKNTDEGEISPFQALMTALSSTIGTGNIAGVATAIAIGGPGALFWMWMAAIFGMATKYSEAVLAVEYREVDKNGIYVGGPMYYIKNGLGKNWKWLGIAFAFFGSLAGFGIANTVQSNSVSQVVESAFDIPPTLTGIVLAILVGGVLLGGITRIAMVASRIVPIMAVIYFVSTAAILIVHLDAIPSAFLLIINSAFSNTAATGGFVGASMILAIQLGVARGIFSNEAGLGSAAIAHAAAATNSPVRQGTVAMLGTFIDTLVICTLTGLVLIVTNVWAGDAQGAAMTSAAFESVIPYGDKLLALCLILFSFTTMIGWSYYGERCAEFLFGKKIIMPFRILWIIGIFAGTQISLVIVWKIADTLNGLMIIPNLIALIFLSPVVFKVTQKYFNKQSSKQD
jgi:AGCS family alanine or glycine:cation symporter